MLKVSHLVGFGARQSSEPIVIPSTPDLRFVGNYTVTWSASATGTGSIPAADLTYDANGHRQVVIFVNDTTSQLVTAVDIDGVDCNTAIITDSTAICAFVAAFNDRTSGNLAITMTATGSMTTTATYSVFEVAYAKPVMESLRSQTVLPSSGLSTTGEVTMTNNAKAIVGARIFPDTSTHTFSGTDFSEVADFDAGSVRAGAALDTNAASGTVRTSVTVTSSATNPPRGIGLTIHPEEETGIVRGGPHRTTLNLTSGDPATANLRVGSGSLSALGTGRMLIAVTVKTTATISSMSVGDQACTFIDRIHNSGNALIELWEWAFDSNSPPANYTVTIDWTAAPGATGGIRFYALYGANSRTTAKTSGNATGAAVNLTVQNGSFLIAFSVRATTSQTTTWTGVTEDDDFVVGSSIALSYGMRPACAAETNRTIQAVGSASGQYATIAIAYHP